MPQNPYGLVPYIPTDQNNYGIQPYKVEDSFSLNPSQFSSFTNQSQPQQDTSFKLNPSQYSSFNPPPSPQPAQGEPGMWDNLTNAWDLLKKYGVPTYNPMSGGVSGSPTATNIFTGAVEEPYKVGKSIIEGAPISRDLMGMTAWSQQTPEQMNANLDEVNRQSAAAWKNPWEVAKAGIFGLDPTGIAMGAVSGGEAIVHNLAEGNPGGAAVQALMLGSLAHHGLSQIPERPNYNLEHPQQMLPGMNRSAFREMIPETPYNAPPAQPVQGSLFDMAPPEPYQGALNFDQYRTMNGGKLRNIADLQNQHPDAFGGILGPTVGEMPKFDKQPTIEDMAPPRPSGPPQSGMWPDLNAPEGTNTSKVTLKNPDSHTRAQLAQLGYVMTEARSDGRGGIIEVYEQGKSANPTAGSPAPTAAPDYSGEIPPEVRGELISRGVPPEIVDELTPDAINRVLGREATPASSPLEPTATDVNDRLRQMVEESKTGGAVRGTGSAFERSMRKSLGLSEEVGPATPALTNEQLMDQMRPPTTSETAPVTEGGTPQVEGVRFIDNDTAVMTHPTATAVEMMRQLGFESAKKTVPHKPGQPGGGLWKRTGEAGTLADTVASRRSRGTLTENDPNVIYFDEKGELHIPVERSKKSVIDNLKAQGIYLRRTENGVNIFSRESAGEVGKRLVKDVSGEWEVGSVAARLAASLRNRIAGVRESVRLPPESASTTPATEPATGRFTTEDINALTTRDQFRDMDSAMSRWSNELIVSGDLAAASASFRVRDQLHARYKELRDAGGLDQQPGYTPRATNAPARTPMSDSYIQSYFESVDANGGPDVATLRELHDRWRSEYESATRDGDSFEVRRSLRRVLNGVRDRLAAAENSTPIVPSTGAGGSGVTAASDPSSPGFTDYIRGLTDINELTRIRTTLGNMYSQAIDVGNTALGDALYTNYREAGARMTAVRAGMTTPSTGVAAPRTGTTPFADRPGPAEPNVPIVSGQYPVPRLGKLKFDLNTRSVIKQDAEQSLKYRGTNTGKVRPQDRPQYHPDGTPNRTTWDEYAKGLLDHVADGPPGLSVEDTYQTRYRGMSTGSTAGHSRYEVIYRDPNGKAVTIAKITERANGRRSVESMGSDRYRGPLHAKGVYAVATKLIEYNAARVDGPFSQHTARLLSRVVELIKDQGGSWLPGEASKNLMNKLKQFKAELTSGKPWFSREIKTPEDMMDIVNELANGKSDASIIQRLLGSDDTGAVGPIQPLIDAANDSAKKKSYLSKWYDLTRTVSAGGDLSAALKQGFMHAFSKDWRKAFGKMVEAVGNQQAAETSLAALKERPLFKDGIDLRTGDAIPSYAKKTGMKLTELDENLGPREETVAGDWSETGAMFGEDLPYVGRETALQRMYAKSAGRAFKATNRGYISFLNELRANSFEALIDNAKRAYESDIATGNITEAKNPMTDLMYGKELADAVNTTTGRGPLKGWAPKVNIDSTGASFGMKQYSIEPAAPVLNKIFFAPKLMSSRVRMLNPFTYIMASPVARRHYLNAAVRSAIMYTTAIGLGKLAGGTVSTDSNSADFGKLRFGNLRLDPAMGHQQYLVALSRLVTGHYTSSASQRDFELGQGYKPDTSKTVAERVIVNKLHPVAKFAYDILDASEHKPVHIGDRVAQLFVPMIVGDMLDLLKEDPKLLPLIIPIGLGMGSQIYDRGETENKFTPYLGLDKADPTYTGGSMFWHAPVKRRGL